MNGTEYNKMHSYFNAFFVTSIAISQKSANSWSLTSEWVFLDCIVYTCTSDSNPSRKSSSTNTGLTFERVEWQLEEPDFGSPLVHGYMGLPLISTGHTFSIQARSLSSTVQRHHGCFVASVKLGNPHGYFILPQISYSQGHLKWFQWQ